MSKFFWLSVITLAIGMFIVGWRQASLSAGITSSSVIKEDHKLEIQNLEAELHVLKKENIALLAEKNNLINGDNKKSEPNISSPVSLSADIKSYPTLADTLAELDRIKAHYKNNPEFDMDAERDKIFMAEPVDKAWAGVREESLLKAFQADPQLQGKPIKAIECRSKHCRIEIYYQDLVETGVVAQYVYKLMGGKQYSELFSGGGEMKISQKDKVLGIYVHSDPKAHFF